MKEILILKLLLFFPFLIIAQMGESINSKLTDETSFLLDSITVYGQYAHEGDYRMIFNYKHAHNLVLTWRQEALKAAPERKLTFLYLANDVIQQSRKKGPKFIDEFGTSLPARPSLCTYFNGWID